MPGFLTTVIRLCFRWRTLLYGTSRFCRQVQ